MLDGISIDFFGQAKVSVRSCAWLDRHASSLRCCSTFWASSHWPGDCAERLLGLWRLMQASTCAQTWRRIMGKASLKNLFGSHIVGNC